MKVVILLFSFVLVISACQSKAKTRPLCSKVDKVPPQGCLDDTHFEPRLDGNEKN
mgnify:CR=1 FL=1